MTWASDLHRSYSWALIHLKPEQMGPTERPNCLGTKSHHRGTVKETRGQQQAPPSAQQSRQCQEPLGGDLELEHSLKPRRRREGKEDPKTHSTTDCRVTQRINSSHKNRGNADSKLAITAWAEPAGFLAALYKFKTQTESHGTTHWGLLTCRPQVLSPRGSQALTMALLCSTPSWQSKHQSCKAKHRAGVQDCHTHVAQNPAAITEAGKRFTSCSL